MKKIVLLCIISPGFLKSQVTLTQTNHAPATGDSYQTYQCDSLNVTPGPAGAGQTWNYVIATHSSMISTYNVSTNANALYSAATVSLTGPGNNYSFFDSDAGTLRYYGGRIVIPTQADVQLLFNTPAVYAKYPMTLNTSSTTNVAGSVTLTIPISTTGTFTGTCIVTADASGTLSLPGITYNNILRVANTQTIDCTTAFGNGVMYQEVYEYYQGGIKQPVFTISSSTLTTPLSEEHQFIVTRLVPPANTVGLNETAFNNGISLYPNPASDKIRLDGAQGTATAVLFMGIDGSLKARLTPDAEGIIDCSTLEEGVYLYQVRNDAGELICTGRQVIIH